MSKSRRVWPWVIALWTLAAVGWPAQEPRPDPEFNTRDFARLPVLLNGRIQPLDSVAHNALLQMRNRRTVLLEGRKSMPAIEWLMEALMKPEVADARKLFRIDSTEMRGWLKLPETEKYFSFDDLRGSLPEIDKQARRIGQLESQERTPFERQVMKLYQGMLLFNRLKNSLKPEKTDDFAAELAQFKAAIEPGVVAVEAHQEGKEFNQEDFDRLLQYLNGYKFMSQMAYPLLIPPAQPEQAREAWSNVGESLMHAVHSKEISPAVERFAEMSTAFRQGKPTEFNQALMDYRLLLEAKRLMPEIKKARWEYFYNSFAPFYKSMMLYVIAFLLACAFWVKPFPWLRLSAFALVLVALAIHSGGLIMRMALEGRPPVTNLYSSAIFIGWGGVVLGVILERLYERGIGVVTASVVGFITLVIAHNLALGGDTMEMLRAVLDTNFWLATHVVTVTLGYSATFVAGFIAVVYILMGTMTRFLSPDLDKALSRIVYGITCFAILFSFTGTILGGIWADQSWGRFWGWDPKENGALLIVLWNAVYLHARWGRLWQERFLMAIAVFGNVVTAFSWFGVNMLGVGLHSYGFMDSAFKWLLLFDFTQLAVIALAFLPKRLWLSFRSRTQAAASAKAASQPAGLEGRKPLPSET